MFLPLPQVYINENTGGVWRRVGRGGGGVVKKLREDAAVA